MAQEPKLWVVDTPTGFVTVSIHILPKMGKKMKWSGVENKDIKFLGLSMTHIKKLGIICKRKSLGLQLQLFNG